MEIFIGVASGVLTAFLMSSSIAFFKKVLIPWYQMMIYEGVDLQDSWKFEDTKDEISTKVKFNLVQSAHNLKGSAIIDVKKEGDFEKNIEYKVAGSVWEGYLTLNLKSANRKMITFGTTLLKVSNDGQTLIGIVSIRNTIEDKVSSVNIVLHRCV